MIVKYRFIVRYCRGDHDIVPMSPVGRGCNLEVRCELERVDDAQDLIEVPAATVSQRNVRHRTRAAKCCGERSQKPRAPSGRRWIQDRERQLLRRVHNEHLRQSVLRKVSLFNTFHRAGISGE